jgi:hypothetical protein
MTHHLLWREPHSSVQLVGRLHTSLPWTKLVDINEGKISPLPGRGSEVQSLFGENKTFHHLGETDSEVVHTFQ